MYMWMKLDSIWYSILSSSDSFEINETFGTSDALLVRADLLGGWLTIISLFVDMGSHLNFFVGGDFNGFFGLNTLKVVIFESFSIFFFDFLLFSAYFILWAERSLDKSLSSKVLALALLKDLSIASL